MLLNLNSLCLSCRPTLHPIEPYHIKLVESHVYAPFCDCNYTLINPKLVINPYEKELKNVVQRNPFGSFCLKCAACLTIAEEIVKTIQDTLDSLNPEDINLEHVNSKVAYNLNALSVHGFKNFGLKKYEYGNVITSKMNCSERIFSNMNGSWTKRLREVCKLYVSYMDIHNMLNGFISDVNVLPQKLCRGSGIFRDCINVSSERYNNIDSVKNSEKCDYWPKI